MYKVMFLRSVERIGRCHIYYESHEKENPNLKSMELMDEIPHGKPTQPTLNVYPL
jgi:hypothetical protein